MNARLANTLHAKGAFPNEMFMDCDPVHTFRTAPTDKGTMIIVPGEHSPAEDPDKGVFDRRLTNYARQHLDVESIERRRSSTDVTTDDGLSVVFVNACVNERTGTTGTL